MVISKRVMRLLVCAGLLAFLVVVGWIPKSAYATVATCPYDYNADQETGTTDLLQVLRNWGKPDQSGAAYGVDSLLGVLRSWGKCPETASKVPCSLVGTHAGHNLQTKNLETIARYNNCDGMIPITVILVPEFTQAASEVLRIKHDLTRLGFKAIFRPWTWPDGNPEIIQQWLNLFALLDRNDWITMWNERNLCMWECSHKSAPTPAEDALTIKAFLEAKQKGQIKIQIGTMPLSALNPTEGKNMHWQEYWTKFVQGCPECMGLFDFIAVNAYITTKYQPGVTVPAFLQDIERQVTYLQTLGVRKNLPVIVTEGGLPGGAYYTFEGASIDPARMQQKIEDYKRFATDLELYLQSKPKEADHLMAVTLLVMDEMSGHQFRFHKDCLSQKTCTWVQDEHDPYGAP